MANLARYTVRTVWSRLTVVRRRNHVFQPSRSFSKKILQERDRGSRDMDVIYGTQPVLAALEAQRRTVHRLYLKDESEQRTVDEKQDKQQVAELYTRLTGQTARRAPRSALNNWTQNGAHQGVVLEASPLDFVPLDWLEPWSGYDRPPLWIALDHVQDPQNFGAILRSCAYFGVDGVVVPHKDTCPLTAVVSKASAGAMEFLPVHQAGHFLRFLTQSKAHGWTILGTASVGETAVKSVFDTTLTRPTILILGNEGRGMADKVRQLCDTLVTVPAHQSVKVKSARLDSLNVSVATGVILSQLTRHR